MSLTPRLDRSESNKIINGNFDFWQRNTSRTIVALASTSDKLYTADRWSHTDFFASGTLTVSRSSDVPSGLSEAIYSMSTQITAAASVAHASNNYHINAGVYRMEGFDTSTMHGKTVTLQFWVKSSLTGLYSISLGASYDSASAKYVSTYTVNTANTWEQKSVTLTIDTSYGTFAKDATQGLFICFGLAANSNGTRLTSSLNQWLTSSGASVASTANRTDFIGTINNTIKLAQVKLSIGSQVTDFSRRGETIGDELILCQRYFEKSARLEAVPFGVNWWTEGVHVNIFVDSGGSGNFDTVPFLVRKRVQPTLKWADPQSNTSDFVHLQTSGGGGGGTNVVAILGNARDNGFALVKTGLTATNSGKAYFNWTADAEL